jgi:hypothetical protein
LVNSTALQFGGSASVFGARCQERLQDEGVFGQRAAVSTLTATTHAPIEKVNIADWILHLPDAEYLRCSTAHIAAGSTTIDDGRPLSINIETIGNAFAVHHYVAK